MKQQWVRRRERTMHGQRLHSCSYPSFLCRRLFQNESCFVCLVYSNKARREALVLATCITCRTDAGILGQLDITSRDDLGRGYPAVDKHYKPLDSPEEWNRANCESEKRRQCEATAASGHVPSIWRAHEDRSQMGLIGH